MRVTCPTCGARYAVDDGAIPPGGRRVQCSACRAQWRASPQAATAPATPPQPTPAQPTPPKPIQTATPDRPQPATMIASLENDAAPARRSGFYAGFIVVALLAFAAVTLYAKQAAIATAAPALAEPLSAYVAAVDRGRTLLADTVAQLREGG